MSRKPLVYGLLTLVSLLMLAPLLMTAFTSLKPAEELVSPPWVPPLAPTFEHFVTTWVDANFNTYFMNSVIISTVDALVMIVIASAAAYALTFLKFPGKPLIYALLLAGLMIPPTAIILPLYVTEQRLGLLNTHLGVILADLALAVPIFIFLMSAYFRRIPKELRDAARVDGASEIQVYWRVILPISTPAIITTGLLEFLWSWNDLLLRLLFLTQDNLRTLTVGMLFFQGTQTRDISGLTSAAMIMAIPIIIIFIIFQRHFVQGMTQGAVK